MGSLRRFCRDHRTLAVLLLALALCMKALVPAGFMVGTGAKVLTIEICADAQGGHLTRQIAIPAKGADGSGSEHKSAPCPYSALGMASLNVADAALLALALAFIVALGFAPTRPAAPRRTDFLRPPLRAPPASA